MSGLANPSIPDFELRTHTLNPYERAQGRRTGLKVDRRRVGNRPGGQRSVLDASGITTQPRM